MTEIQRAELKEYLETILDLYGEDEYEEFVEDIVYHYCVLAFHYIHFPMTIMIRQFYLQI